MVLERCFSAGSFCRMRKASVAVNVSAGMTWVQSSQCCGNLSSDDDSQKFYSITVYMLREDCEGLKRLDIHDSLTMAFLFWPLWT